MSGFVSAKSDLEDFNSLPVAMVTDMQYPGVYTKTNSVNIPVATDFCAVFRTDIVINQSKFVLVAQNQPHNGLQNQYFGFLTFFEFFATFHAFSFFGEHYLLSGK